MAAPGHAGGRAPAGRGQGHLVIVTHLIQARDKGLLFLTKTRDARTCTSRVKWGSWAELAVVKELDKAGGNALLFPQGNTGCTCLAVAFENGQLESAIFLVETGGERLVLMTWNSDNGGGEVHVT